MEILNNIIDMAKKNRKKIILPESDDIRVIRAACYIQDNEIADIVLIGNKEEILNLCNKNNIEFNYDIDIVDISKEIKLKEKYAKKLYELRKNKNVSLSQARKLVEDSTYFAVMMAYFEEADGVVSGATHSTSDTLRPALQIIDRKSGVNSISSFFIMQTENKDLGHEGIFLFADCGLIKSPNVVQLQEIACMSAQSFRKLIAPDPKIAFLSYSTLGSARGEEIDKITRAVKGLKSKNVDFEFDGELQFDAAVIKEVAKIKAKNSSVAGCANVLIFPNLEAGNIGYKIAQRLGNMTALGPITQGFTIPVNDLSRGCSVDDIIGVVAISSIQASS